MDSTATPADHRHQHQLHQQQQQQQYQHLSSNTPQVSAAGEAAKQVSTTTTCISRADHSSSELLKLTNLKLTDDYLKEEAAAGSGAMLVAANDQQQQQQPKIETSSFNEQQHHFTTNSTNFDLPNNTYIGHYENHLYHQNHQQHLSPGAVGGSTTTTTTSSTANTTGAAASARYTAASASGSFVPGEQYVSVHEPLVVDSFLDMSVIYPQSGAAYSAVDEADPAAASYYQGSAVECGQPEVLRVDHSRSRRTPSGAMGLLQQHHAYYAQSASAAQLGSAGAAAEPQSDSGHVSSVSLTNSLEAIHSSHSQNQHSAGSLLNLSAATATTSSGLVGRHAHSDSFPTAPHLSNLSQHHQHNQHHHHQQQQQQQPSQNRLLSCVSEQNFTTYSYSSSNNIIDVGSNNIDQHELQHQHHHEHQHHQEPELKVCEWEGCGNTFLDMEAFVKHLEERHVNQGPKVKNRYFCLWANCKRNEQEFNARYKLLIHMRVHSGEKPYPCNNENCKKSFSRLENLKIHVRSHTGEKPYKCSYERCAKSFTNSSDRIKHHKTHKDPKPYSCNYNGCPKRYTDPSSLRKHLRAHKKAQVVPAIIVGATAAATCASDFDPASLLPADSLMAAATSGAADSSFSGYTPNQQQQQHYQLSRSWCAGARPATAATPTSLAPTSGWLAADHAALNRSFPAPNYPQEAQPQQQQQYLGVANRAAYEP